MLIRARMMAAALLFHGGEMLMMKRSPNRTLNPGMWATVGGHMEPAEINDPEEAVRREIFEETGLTRSDIADLRLQYILIRLNRQEVRQQFIYTARAARRDVSETDEGELHWIPREEVLDRDIPFIFRELLAHYFRTGPSSCVWVGTAGYDAASQPAVHWTALVDPLRV